MIMLVHGISQIGKHVPSVVVNVISRKFLILYKYRPILT